MIFRPAPVLTLAMLGALAILLALGTWQVNRLAWKTALIAQIEARTKEPPTALDLILASQAPVGEMEYSPVRVRGRFDHAREIHLFTNYQGTPGYFIITPLIRSDGSAVLVNRGYAPIELKDPALRREGLVEGEVEIEGLLRASRSRAPFAPDDQPEENIWFTADAEAMAFIAGVEAPPLFIDALADQTRGPWPRGGVTRLEFRNAHLGYAITWYGLAATLLGVYFTHQYSVGRIRFGAPAEATEPDAEKSSKNREGAS
ncbi:MAG: SURF1 family protein [Parvularculaceae bacterium]